MKLEPEEAVLLEEERTRTVAAADLQAGDLILIKPGNALRQTGRSNREERVSTNRH